MANMCWLKNGAVLMLGIFFFFNIPHLCLFLPPPPPSAPKNAGVMQCFLNLSFSIGDPQEARVCSQSAHFLGPEKAGVM